MASLRFPGIALLVFLVGFLQSAKSQDIRITEFLAVNTAGITDNDGSLQGWIEIWNPSNSVNYSLGGWKLRHKGTVWNFPVVQLPPKDRLLIWASGKNRIVATAPLHTSFTLDPAGGEGVSLELLRADNSVASSYINYPAQTANVAYGRDDGDVTQVGYYEEPSPELENNFKGTGVSGDIAFSKLSSSFTGNFQLTLSEETPAEGAVIRYTTNGTVPTSASTLYTGPFTVTATTIVRARVFAPGKLPGETEAQCFLLLDTNSSNFDSGMPVIVLTNFGAGTPVDGSGSPPENPGYMWVFEPGTDGRARLTNAPDLSVRVAMDRRGSSTLGNPKHNLNIETRKDRGDFEKDVALLGMPEHSDWVFHAPYDFDRALLRNIFMYSLSNQIGRYAPRGKFAEVFIDTGGGALTFTNAGSGDYYGVYNIFEKIRRGTDRIPVPKLNRYDNDLVSKTGGYIIKVDRRDTGDAGFSTGHESLLAYYYPKEVDLISTQRDPQEQYIRTYMQQLDAASYTANYKDPVLGYRNFVDVPAAIDHHLLNVWPMNVDALRLSGYMHKDRGGKIIYGPIWDFDRSMDSTDGRDDQTNTWRSTVSDFGTDFFNYTWWSRWFSDIDFYQAYIDRWFELRSGNGPLSATSVNALLDNLNGQMTAQAVQRDLVRWARTKRAWTSPFTGTQYTGQTAEVQRIKDWLQRRAIWMETQWVGPVTVSPAGGNFAAGTQVTLSGPANSVIYYTTDGSDPRPPGGAVPSAANVMTYTAPFTVSATTRIRARAYKASHTALTGANNPSQVSRWSARTDVRFAVEAPVTAGALAVTEVNYHPANPTTQELATNSQLSDSDFEFIEFRNIGTTAVDLGGASFAAGIVFTFANENAISIAPGEYVIVAANPTAFALRYGSKPNVVGPYTGDLANGGEQVKLVDAAGQKVVDFSYDDFWYPTTDGGGPTLVSYNFTAAEEAFSTPANWRPSAAVGGTPGAADGAFVSTLNATDIGVDTVQLNAIVSTNGLAVTPSFKIGEVTYPADPIPAGGGVVNVARVVTGLLPHTTYTVAAQVDNGTAVTVGNSVEFTTLNRVPDATDKTLHIVGVTPFEIDVMVGATDPDGDALDIADVTQGQHGAVSIENGKVLYTPAATYVGNDTFTFVIDDGFGGSDTATVTLENVVPVAVADSIVSAGQAVTLDVRSNDLSGDLDPLAVSSVTNGAFGNVVITAEGLVTYTPGATYPGADSFSYTVTDGTASATATVSVRSTSPVFIAGPSVGTQVPGQPAGTVYGEFGLPNSGVISGAVKLSNGVSQAAIFKADGTVQLKVGDTAPLVPGAVISSLGQLTGHAVIATLSGAGVTAANDTILYAGLDDIPRIVAREGDPLVPGTKLKKFVSVDGNGATVFILVKVAGGGVKPTNDTALAAAPAGAATRVVLREGGIVEGQVVSQINTLVPSRPTLAEGRWRYDGTTVGVRVVLPRKVQALYTVQSVANQTDVFSLWGKTTELNLPNGTAKKLGLPGYSPDGVAYTTQLKRVPRSVTAANDMVLVRATDEGTAVLATKGSAAPGATGQPLAGANFAKFSDPVSGNNQRTAFAATLSGGGVSSTSKSGLWYFDGVSPLRLLARAGDPVEGGGVWGAFESLVLPDGENSGPMFTATLARNAALGITADNNRGLWAVDSEGVLRLLVRTGQPLTVNGASRVVKSFTALTPLPGSPGVASGYNDHQQVGVIATFTDGSTTLVNIVIP